MDSYNKLFVVGIAVVAISFLFTFFDLKIIATHKGGRTLKPPKPVQPVKILPRKNFKMPDQAFYDKSAAIVVNDIEHLLKKRKVRTAIEEITVSIEQNADVEKITNAFNKIAETLTSPEVQEGLKELQDLSRNKKITSKVAQNLLDIYPLLVQTRSMGILSTGFKQQQDRIGQLIMQTMPALTNIGQGLTDSLNNGVMRQQVNFSTAPSMKQLWRKIPVKGSFYGSKPTAPFIKGKGNVQKWTPINKDQVDDISFQTDDSLDDKCTKITGCSKF